MFYLKKGLLVFAMLFCVVFANAQTPISGFTYIGNLAIHQYYVSNQTMNWDSAMSVTVSAGGHMLTVSSPTENYFVWNQIVNIFGERSYWLGFTDVATEGSWQWVTNEPVTYSNFRSGQPDNYNNQDYASVWNVFGPATWDDSYGIDHYYVVLEFDSLVPQNSPPCPPTTISFIDNFDSSTLDSCWTWIREDTSHWSLTERDGWMRVWTQPGRIYYGDGKNFLLRPRATADYQIETKLILDPTQNYQNGGILVYLDNSNMVEFVRHYYDGQKITGSVWNNGIITSQVEMLVSDTLVFLRLMSLGNTFTFSWSSDGLAWILLGQANAQWATNSQVRFGIQAASNYVDPPHIPVDFDYFRVDSISGTQVCANISGVWDSTGSPYYVTCDVTVPAGQTLEIRPGVQVLFTGHYKFNVLGNLQAIGTEQDSIIFTRAFPTQESRGWGIRFADEADDASRLAYCISEYGSVTGSGYPDGYGGGILINHCNITVEHSSIRRNSPNGITVLGNCNPIFSYCRIEDNTADGGDGGGGIEHEPWPENGGNITLDHCLIQNNISNAGGAIWQGRANFLITNCTITHNFALDNFSSGGGGGIDVWHSAPYTVTLQNTILWGDSATSGPEIFFGEAAGTVVATYSNIGGGYAGIGNIDFDPQFVDAVNGDFHLQASSPCIDTGDPNSPLDPDLTRADMGAFPYFHPITILSPNGGETWTLFTTDTVRWTSTGITGTVNIELNTNYPSGSWVMIAADSPNDGIEPVFVDFPLSNLCRVRITAVEENVNDISNNNFTIGSSQGFLALVRLAQPTLQVTNWNAGTLECPNVGVETFRCKNFGTSTIRVFRALEPVTDEFSRVTNCPAFYDLTAGQMSSCDVSLNFIPESDGTFHDTLRIQTNASNGVGGFLKVPLSGTQITTPQSPQIVITREGINARLRWNPITLSTGGCPITPTAYLVYYSTLDDNSYDFHGYTTDTSYVHTGVFQFAPSMFYRVTTFTGPLMLIEDLPPNVTQAEVELIMNN